MKWLGMGMILAGSAGFGVWYSLLYVRQWNNLLACRKAIMILRGEIAFGQSVLPQAFSRAASRVSGDVRRFLEHVVSAMDYGGQLEQIWGQALESEIGNAMGKEAREELRELGNMLGFLDLEMQLQSLDVYLKRLDLTIRECESERKNRTRLYPLLGTMAGILLCIILI